MAHPAAEMLKQTSLASVSLPDTMRDAESSYFEVDVPPDGSCLFYSIALSFLLPVLQDKEAFEIRYYRLFGKEGLAEDATERLRQVLASYDGRVAFIEEHVVELEVLVDTRFRTRLVDYMRSRETQFSRDEYQEEKSFNGAMSRMAQAKTWGGHREIEAASQYLERQIIAYEKVRGRLEERARYGERYRSQPLYLIRTSMQPDGVVLNHYHYLLAPQHLPRREAMAASSAGGRFSEEAPSAKLVSISKADIQKLLADLSINYQSDISQSVNNRDLIQNKLERILTLTVGSLRRLITDEWLTNLGQQLELFGHAVDATPSSEVTHKTTVLKDAEGKALGERAELKTVGQAIACFNGWEEASYLLFMLLFYITRYLQLIKSASEAGRIQEELKLSQTPTEGLKAIYLNELWIAMNAYLLNKQIKSARGNREQLLEVATQLIERIKLNAAKDGASFENEYCIPCGSKGHAVYVNLYYHREPRLLILRVDDSASERKPLVSRCVLQDDVAVNALIAYLSEVFTYVETEENEAMMRAIYNEGDTPHRLEVISEASHDYPALETQVARNCVVMGGRRSQWYRQCGLLETGDDRFYLWLLEETKKFAVTLKQNKSPAPMGFFAMLRQDAARMAASSQSVEADAKTVIAKLLLQIIPPKDSESYIYKQREQALFIAAVGNTLRNGARESDFDLGARITDFLINANHYARRPKKVLLLLGEGGAGKSMFGEIYSRDLLMKYETGAPIPLYIPLSTIEQPQEQLLDEYCERCQLTTAEKAWLIQQKLLIILDAFDEAKQKQPHNLYNTNQLETLRNAKVIITCRTSHLTHEDNYKVHFTPHQGGAARPELFEEMFVVPFNSAQIQAYTDKYIEQNQDELQQLEEGKWLQRATFERYLQLIPGLSGLAQTPLLLKITLEVLPDIAKRYEESHDKYVEYTQRDLFIEYMAAWFLREEGKLKGEGIHPNDTSPDDAPYINLMEKYKEFCEGLAYRMGLELEGKGIYLVTYPLRCHPSASAQEKQAVLEYNEKWAAFFGEHDGLLKLVRRGAPLRKPNLNQYAFLHTELQYYFSANHDLTVTQVMMQNAAREVDAAPAAGLMLSH